ncbi:MAG TPA: PSD1 and planctomycete cytochrome C domain-containing protein [Bryobacteraceae bacterium]|nr:PSD1 and planctomycete cytochrome C domain-containing protein [Bryobacteraceae bacterium]
MRRRLLLGFVVLAQSWAQERTVTFAHDIKPLLENRCLKCHGPAMQLGKLDLRDRASAMRGAGKGAVLTPGDPEKSPLYRHVAGLDKPRMPMDGPLKADEIAAVRIWIEQGAAWEGTLGAPAAAKQDLQKLEQWIVPAGAREQWAFRQPSRPPVPRNGAVHPVDAFLRQSLSARGLTQAPKADAHTLVRRAYLDLLGLPPSPEEVRQFVEDKEPRAWERLIDKLLASPQYGERWGRHWLDVARYADSNGYEHDFDRPNAWRYRDYVIQAFNKDTPFDVFLQEQLAGDEMPERSHDRLIATAFLRNYAKVGFREKDNPQFRFEYLDDMIATIGRGLMGITVQCARCHNHKFDPIGQADYYRLQASLWGYVEVDHPLTPEAEARAYQEKVTAVAEQVRPLREEIRSLEQPYRDALLQEKYKKWPLHIQKAVFTPESERTAGQVLLANQIIRTTSVTSSEIDKALRPDDLAKKRALEARIRMAEKDRPSPIPVAMGITDGDYRLAPDGAGDEPAPGKGTQREKIEGTFLSDGLKPYAAPPSYFLHGGDIHSRGSLTQPGFVAVLDDGATPAALPPADGRTSGRRLALAKWLTSGRHPLTARVMVNRIWHHHFGRGIVTTLDNFGKTGEPPTHPELLDWLAVEFVEKGWSIKQMHRLLMTSQAYQMSSQWVTEKHMLADAGNQLWWRYRAQRLEAEIVRDNILAVSGALNRTAGGKAIFPELPKEVLASMDKGVWDRTKDGPAVWRRSIYVYRKRGLPLPFFEVFDLPDQNLTCGRRNVSTVPTQALTLMNNEWVLRQASRLADRIATEAGSSGIRAQIARAYELALGRAPKPAEFAANEEFLKTHTLSDLAHVILNLNEFIYLR